MLVVPPGILPFPLKSDLHLTRRIKVIMRVDDAALYPFNLGRRNGGKNEQDFCRASQAASVMVSFMSDIFIIKRKSS